MVTALLRAEHRPMSPRFVLAPWPVGLGWRAYIPELELGLKVAGNIHNGVLFRKPVMIRCSGLIRARAPQISGWGKQLVVVKTMTPICLRKTVSSDRKRKHYRKEITVSNLLSVLSTWLPNRLGIQLEDGCLDADVVALQMKREIVPVGGKLGKVIAHRGVMVLRANGPTRWLLKATETVGLGGRSAYGFGRVIVSEHVD
jgi:hypothetical protein